MKLFKIIAAIGCIFIVGTVGASDAELINFGELIRRLAFGFSLAFGGAFLAKCTTRKTKRCRTAEIIPIESLKRAG